MRPIRAACAGDGAPCRQCIVCLFRRDDRQHATFGCQVIWIEAQHVANRLNLVLHRYLSIEAQTISRCFDDFVGNRGDAAARRVAHESQSVELHQRFGQVADAGGV
jgi:hypothetical protein